MSNFKKSPTNFFLFLTLVLSSCSLTNEVCSESKTNLRESVKIHSDDWYSQQNLARYLKTLPKNEFENFIGIYLISDEDLQKLDSLASN